MFMEDLGLFKMCLIKCPVTIKASGHDSAGPYPVMGIWKSLFQNKPLGKVVLHSHTRIQTTLFLHLNNLIDLLPHLKTLLCAEIVAKVKGMHAKVLILSVKI